MPPLEATHSQKHIVVQASRCRRMRLDSNDCRLCEAACYCQAVSVEPAPAINAKLCTRCEICVSECPDDALRCRRPEFTTILERLGEHDSPVLACRYRDSKGHVVTPCLGWLTEEHLIALAVQFPGGVQVNLTRCEGCVNGLIVERLVGRMAFVTSLYGPGEGAPISLIQDPDALDFRPLETTRRGFFASLRQGATRAVEDIRSQGREDPAMGYGDKIIPQRRVALNTALPLLPEGPREKVLKRFYHEAEIVADCSLCMECAAVCPTGALIENDDDRLEFDPRCCTGCGLCEEFCSSNALRIKSGVGPAYRTPPEKKDFALVPGLLKMS